MLVSLCGLVVLFFPMLLIAAVIWLDDPSAGPIFTQTRCGRHGEPFRIYKFRTMSANAEKLRAGLAARNEMDGPAFKIKDDPRITRVGGFLRRTSLDELPQLLNVLHGEMCVVGPRPPLPEEVALYTPYQHQRLMVTPGLTCYWQTMPQRNSIPFAQWVELDLRYIRERSLGVDVRLICKTVLVMFRGEGR